MAAGIEAVYRHLALAPAPTIAAERIHIYRLGRRIAVINPADDSVSDAIAALRDPGGRVKRAFRTPGR